MLYKALDLPSGQRQRFVANACHGAPALLVQVQILLARIDVLDALVATPFALFAPKLPPPVVMLPPGAMLADWRLLRELGRDGEDVVVLAERIDGAARRAGAFKAALASASCVATQARFARERQVLSRLNHPDIARMVDAGRTRDGRPFFVMDLPGGVPLDQYCVSQQLSLRQCAALFARVCNAVQHAHQLALIHRDLTPANIVVAPDGSPKVLGFGIAGEAGLWAPTPRFASPEQLAGQAPSTSADIYALGAILSDVLGKRCAKPDAPAATSGATVRSASAQASAALRVLSVGSRASWSRVSCALLALLNALLRPARTLLRRGSGDLEQILSRALEPDPARRYPAADAFARHLQRYAHKRAFDAAQLAPSPPRRPLRGASVAILVGVLVLGSALALWKAGEGGVARLVADHRDEPGRVQARAVLYGVSDALDGGAPLTRLGAHR